MSLLEISVGLAVVSLLTGGIIIKYSGRADEARLAAELEYQFTKRASFCPKEGEKLLAAPQDTGWHAACYLNKSGIAEVKYVLPRDPSEKRRVLKSLRRIGGHYNADTGAVTFDRAFVSRNLGQHRAFRHLVNEGYE